MTDAGDQDTIAMSPAEALSRIDELLEATHASADLGNLQDVLGETVYILLSKQTREVVYQRVFADLRRRFPTWTKLAKARQSTIERVVAPAGFGKQRASQLHRLIRAVDETNRNLATGPYGPSGGDLTLEFLSEWHPADAERYLEQLPGVGPKSARCVMSYCLGQQRFAVDTHVRRVMRRLQLVDDRSWKPDHDAFERVVPPRMRLRLHVNLVHHGRAICTETSPRCDQCPLVSFCPAGRAGLPSRCGTETAIDLFAGAGAMGLGFKQAGFRMLAAVEIDRHAAQTYRLNHPGVPVLEHPVQQVTAGVLRAWIPGMPSPSAVIAGPPCQGYSAAGARTIGDERNLLFKHVSRIAKELNASAVLIENVPGVRRVNGVRYTHRITDSLRENGFNTWAEPVMLRASDFGVPQNRRRLFFVGVAAHLALPPAPQPTHRPPGSEPSSLLPTPTLAERLADLPALAAGEGAERLEMADGRIILNSTVMNHSAAVVRKIRAIPAGGGPISYRRLDRDLARTLVAGHRALPVHPEQDRAITVREAARIQGFPDTYFFCGPRAWQPLQVANAVPPALSRAVANQLHALLTANRDRSAVEEGAA